MTKESTEKPNPGPARRALYAALLAPELPGSTKAAMFLSLLFRAVKADVAGRRVAAFLKRLLQVALAAPPNLACGCLLLASELLKVRPPSKPGPVLSLVARSSSTGAGARLECRQGSSVWHAVPAAGLSQCVQALLCLVSFGSSVEGCL